MWLSTAKSVSVNSVCPSKGTVSDEGEPKSDEKLVKESASLPSKIDDEPLTDIIFAALIGKFAKISFPPPDEVVFAKPDELVGPCDYKSEDVPSDNSEMTNVLEPTLDKSNKPLSNSQTKLPAYTKSGSISTATNGSRASKSNKGAKNKRKKTLSEEKPLNKPIDLVEDDDDYFDDIATVGLEKAMKTKWKDIFEVMEENDQAIDVLWQNDNIELEFYNGRKFNGKMKNSLREGQGTYTWPDGSLFKGTYSNDFPNGYGEMHWSSLTRYEGNFLNGKMHGFGSIFQDMCSYTGDWVEGQKHGKGKIIYSDYSSYEGDFVKSEREGHGLRCYSSGSKYQGAWKNGLRHGYGIMLWSNNDMYIGNWKCGEMDGHGKYIWDTFSNDQFVYPLHNCFIGEWKNGIRDGNGTLILSSGAVVSTVWQNGIKNGPGKVLCTNGTTIEAQPLFVNDNIVGMYKVAKINENDIKEMNLCKGWTQTMSTQSLVDLSEENTEDLRIRNFRACVIPLNIPPYFMNLDFHLDKLFKLDDWEERIAFKEEFSLNLPYHCIEDNSKEELDKESFFCSYESLELPISSPPLQISGSQSRKCTLHGSSLSMHINQSETEEISGKNLVKIKCGLMSDRVSLTSLKDIKPIKFTYSMESRDSFISDRTLFSDFDEKTPSVKSDDKIKDEKKFSKSTVSVRPSKCISKVLPKKSCVRKESCATDILYKINKDALFEDKRPEMKALSLLSENVSKKEFKVESESSLSSGVVTRCYESPCKTQHGNNLENQKEEMFIKHFCFEKKWLRNTIINHSADLNFLYQRYATICCKEEPNFEVGMLRIMLWKLLRDCGVYETGYSIIEMDKIAVRQSNPFDFVPVSEMIHYLLILSWELFTKKKKVNKDIPGVLGGGFDLFLKSRVYPSAKKYGNYGQLIPDFKKIPLEATYKFFLSFGPNMTIASLVKRIFRKEKSFTFDADSLMSMPKSDEYFLKALTGNNIILPGGEIMYKKSEEIQGLFEKPVSFPTHRVSLDIDIFSILGHDLVLDAIISACITKNDILENSINKDMELSFLEFMYILTNLIHEFMKIVPTEDKHLQFKESVEDPENEKQRLTVEKCLDKLINIAKEKLRQPS